MIRNACPYLQQIQQDHELGRCNYLHSEYDTFVYFPTFTETNVLTMVRNCFVEALNRRSRFPSAVVILLSDQLIIEDPLYLPSEIDRKIKWILRELDAAIKIKKSLLPTKAYTFGEPRIMWVRMFQNTRANYIPTDILLKFNNMLRKTCIAKAVYTIPVEGYEDSLARCYDYDGKTQIKEGFELLWLDIIKGIKKHDQSDKLAEIAATIKEHCPVKRNDEKSNIHSDDRSRLNDRQRSHMSKDYRNDKRNQDHNRSSSRRSRDSSRNWRDDSYYYKHRRGHSKSS